MDEPAKGPCLLLQIFESMWVTGDDGYDPGASSEGKGDTAQHSCPAYDQGMIDSRHDISLPASLTEHPRRRNTFR